MEELHRIQPDAPFGWVLALQELVAKWGAKRRTPAIWRDSALDASRCAGLECIATPR